MSYFADHCAQLRLLLKKQPTHKLGLREAQLGAYHAVLAHFTASDDPCMVAMPTGSGKTALIPLLAFGLAAERVLVITPAALLRLQTAEEVAALHSLKSAGAVPRNLPLPSVEAVDNRLTAEKDWLGLKRFDLVVTTPECASPGQPHVHEPPANVFDLMIMDEAHHAPAETWDHLLTSFRSSKCILLTATPFRRDKRRFRAALAYNYPLRRAIESGIYDVVEYVPVRAQSPATKHADLCGAAVKTLRRAQRGGKRAQLFVRTDRIQHADELAQLYASEGATVRVVHTGRSERENEAAVSESRSGNVDGLVCVGMLGEGLDIPSLKVAVFHAAPRSLPLTLQLIGRVCRQRGRAVGRPFLVAAPHDVDGPMRQLYREDADWQQLIPDLAAEAVQRTRADQQLDQAVEGKIFAREQLAPSRLAPFFSVQAFLVAAADCRLSADVELPGVHIVHDFEVPGRACRVFVTERAADLPWAPQTELQSIEYDLHILYYHATGGFLFAFSTSEGLGREIRRCVASDQTVRRIPPGQLSRAIDRGRSLSYVMVGLQNALGATAASPSYKTLLGRNLEGAIRPSEGKVFAVGHALARVEEEHTVGIAQTSGRVWSIRRGGLLAFCDWCRRLGDALRDAAMGEDVPLLSFLAERREAVRFDSIPIAVCCPPQFLMEACVLRRASDVGRQERDVRVVSPAILDPKLSADGRTMTARFYPNPDEEPLELSYVPQDLYPWQVTGDEEGSQWRIIRLAAVTVRDRNLSLRDFLSDPSTSPVVVMADGSTMMGTQQLIARRALPAVPRSCLRRLDWQGCDITAEYTGARRGSVTVHAKIEQLTRREISESAVVFRDHGPGEFADYVVVDPVANRPVVWLCHAKASASRSPGVRVTDHYELLGQVCRSADLIRSASIVAHVLERERLQHCGFRRGSRKELRRIAAGVAPREFQYRVVAVQPGLSGQQLYTRKNNVSPLLLAAYEWIRGLEADLDVWCS